MSNLEKIAKELGETYHALKDAEAKKDKLRKEFFNAATRSQQEQTRVQSSYVPARITRRSEAVQYVQQHHPGWLVEHLEQAADGGWQAVIREDPAYVPFTFVAEDGYVYERQVVSGSLNLDDDRLQRENPGLWEAVTHIPEPKRELRPFEEMSAEQLEAVQEYLFYGPPKLRLAPPKKAEQ